MKEYVEQVRKKIYEYEVKVANRQVEDVSIYMTNNFLEYGKSGNIIYYNDVIEHYKNCTQREYLLDNFEIEILSDYIVQTRYISTLDDEHVLRSSLWKLIDNHWKMFFHQGTKIK